jgi:hypothetical protein
MIIFDELLTLFKFLCDPKFENTMYKKDLLQD